MSLSVLKVKATEGSKANCPFPSSSSRYFFPLVLLVSYYVSENRKSSFLLLFIVCQLFLLHLLAYRLLLCVFYILSVCISAFRNCVFSYLLLSRTSSCWICILHFCPTRISKTEESLEKVIKRLVCVTWRIGNGGGTETSVDGNGVGTYHGQQSWNPSCRFLFQL